MTTLLDTAPDVESPTDDTDTDDLDALFASVTPGAHRDLVGGSNSERRSKSATTPPTVANAAPIARKHKRPLKQPVTNATPVPTQPSAGPWKAIAILVSGALVVALLAFAVVPFVFNLGASGGGAAADSGGATPLASGGVDMAQVSALMQKIAADPKDIASLQQLGDLYYQASDFANAATFYDKVLALDPKNVRGLLARGAVYYNGGDMPNAKKDWDLVVSIDAKNVEAHYDLGFLAMNQASPDWGTVQTEWQTVIALDPGSSVATTVQQHLDALAKASMLPGASPAASAATTAGSTPEPSASQATSSPGDSAKPSTAPSASPTPTSSASGRP